MVSPRAAYLALVALFAAERAVELALSRRHARALRARGAVEHGAGHYPAMVLLHGAFLAACAAGALLRPAPPRWALLAAAAALAAQALRWWAIAALGERWTTRVLVLPGAPPVTGGPYRFVRHPNYLAVAVELAALPLAWGLAGVALLFSVANAAVLAARVRAEERALGPVWRRAFEARGRFLPGSPRARFIPGAPHDRRAGARPPPPMPRGTP
ncbi:isoprenylcysteine carboxylmethyltransferase family protein [Anaeromyxobacter diazotrophicus]|uniref:Isoprenylcysteine carboxyl methyltransferase n=1 Tax=Anaeromyxobacter diazotrophicus TaxID=2590199 RepID=A0A7I9VQU3_9BACT|nr:isoprenylcysteine carboxylmethyltransferase family protein [Anaeromyxobacter diazotrophicus]GEJ58490.1 isoprenylcysteine carboxyl methyltransferase [Anaeromyxobacter diazotrophicus]